MPGYADHVSLHQIRVSLAERLPAGRVCAADLLRLLHDEADRTGDEQYRVSEPTVRKWKSRQGWKGRGYSPAEVVEYLTARGTRGQHRPGELPLIN